MLRAASLWIRYSVGVTMYPFDGANPFQRPYVAEGLSD